MNREKSVRIGEATLSAGQFKRPKGFKPRVLTRANERAVHAGRRFDFGYLKIPDVRKATETFPRSHSSG
jgi:hypothetical protein